METLPDNVKAPGPPPPDSIAFFVRMQRGLWRWKQPTLAAMSGVSLATVQRIERGETVSTENLSKVAVALGFAADYLTAPRHKLPEDEAIRTLENSLAWMKGKVEVSVAPLHTEKQLRALSSTDMIVLDSDLEGEAADDLAELREWLDLISFMRCCNSGLIAPKPDRSFRIRELYDDLFRCLKEVHRRHQCVCLVGTYTAQTDAPKIPMATVAVMALRSKVRNPAAAKLGVLWCEQRISWKSAMEQLP